ncbi:hypothetical protein [Neisseria sp. CCUG12390]|uniref:hypothetical protein n=1 Tax=Neisseria sp. CCUG12390 TaxID=3392035 RepID=UPI003A0FFCBF
MVQNLPNRPDFWRMNLIAVLQQNPKKEGIGVLAQLRHDTNPAVAGEAKRTILKIARKSHHESAYSAQLQQLAVEISAEKKTFRFFRFLQRKQPDKTAA